MTSPRSKNIIVNLSNFDFFSDNWGFIRNASYFRIGKDFGEPSTSDHPTYILQLIIRHTLLSDTGVNRNRIQVTMKAPTILAILAVLPAASAFHQPAAIRYNSVVRRDDTSCNQAPCDLFIDSVDCRETCANLERRPGKKLEHESWFASLMDHANQNRGHCPLERRCQFNSDFVPVIFVYSQRDFFSLTTPFPFCLLLWQF